MNCEFYISLNFFWLIQREDSNHSQGKNTFFLLPLCSISFFINPRQDFKHFQNRGNIYLYCFVHMLSTIQNFTKGWVNEISHINHFENDHIPAIRETWIYWPRRGVCPWALKPSEKFDFWVKVLKDSLCN